MTDVVLPIAVLAMFLVFVDQIRRLISHAIINGTIRQALRSDPASVPLLVTKLENGRHLPGKVIGWVMIAGASALALAAMFEAAAERQDAFQIAGIAAIVGAFTLA